METFCFCYHSPLASEEEWMLKHAAGLLKLVAIGMKP